MHARDTAQRVADAQRRLASEACVWIATASAAGEPHLVALSLWWDGHALMATTPAGNPVGRNIAATKRARASLPDAEDVVTMKAEASVIPLAEIEPASAIAMVEALGWDPRNEPGDWVLITLVPTLVWAWNGLHEVAGRTIMRNSTWLA